MTDKGVRLLVIAGEVSGDTHGKALLTHLREIFPNLQASGIGGQGMEEAGLMPLAPFASMQIIGIVDALLRYRKIKRMLRYLRCWVEAHQPHAVLLIDYSGFNLRLAKQIHGLNIPILFYSCPQVWASRKKRIETIAKYITRIAVLLPFEEPLLKNAGIDARFFGHPLASLQADAGEVAALRNHIQNSLPKGAVVGLIPGSRPLEIKQCFPHMLQAAKNISELGFAGRFVVPLSSNLDVTHAQKLIARYGPKGRVLLVENAFLPLLPLLDFAICTSGSATAQVAMHGVPMLVVYKLGALNAFIIRRMLYIRHVALFNILANKEIIPELIQENMTAPHITRTFMDLANSPQAQKIMRHNCLEVYKTLKQPQPYRQAVLWFAQTIKAAL